MFEAGMNVVRLNFSHGDPSAHISLAGKVRERARACNKPVGVLADLQGPKIRIARFHDGHVLLKENQRFILDASLGTDAGNETEVGIDYKALPSDVSAGDTLLLDDGRIVLKVEAVDGKKSYHPSGFRWALVQQQRDQPPGRWLVRCGAD
jgi:pyruvate kinase